MVWHEHGPDLSSLSSEFAKDPRLVDEMLTRGLARRDPTAPEAIAFLEAKGMPCPVARGRLPDAWQRGGTWFRFRCVWALLILTEDARWEEFLIEKVKKRRRSTRIEATGCLASVEPTVAVLNALEAAVSDSAATVRGIACSALLRYAGSEALFWQNPHYLAVLFPRHRIQIRRADRERWRAVGRELGTTARAALRDATRPFLPQHWP